MLTTSLRGAEPLEELVDRFLVARKGKVADALKMLVEDLEWREKEGTLELQAATAHQVRCVVCLQARCDMPDADTAHAGTRCSMAR
eukprot:3246560-Rhodomonas_salina.4